MDRGLTEKDLLQMRYIRRAMLAVLVTALAFWAFFQLSKTPVISAVNPFADDPVDAIGSITFQVAVVCGILNLARFVRYVRDPEIRYNRAHLILHGSAIALGAIGITLIADAIAELQQPTWGVSIWGALLAAGLVVMALLLVWAGLMVVGAAREINAIRPAQSPLEAAATGSLADTIEDLWLLAWIPLTWLRRRLEWVNTLVAWGERFTERHLLPLWARLDWVNPRFHPWRFCLLVALAAGVGLAVAHGVLEGPPDSLSMAILASSIFIGFETAAVLLSFLLFGGLLGLRPPLRLRRTH